MFKISPINDKNTQRKYAELCGAEYKENYFAYSMIDDTSGDLMGFSQFEITEKGGFISDIRALIGTFDYENIGDLLFPTVLKAQLEKRIKLNKLFLISLNGCTRPLDETNETVYPIDMLESLHLKYGLFIILLCIFRTGL